MSQSSSLPSQPFEEYESSQPSRPPQGTAAWKQEVNQKLAAHRTHRARQGGPQDAAHEAATDRELDSPRSASARAAEARARVAARYAKAPSYSELLAGEARAVVKAAGAAAEAARNAQAAAQAVLSGLEAEAVSSENWERTRHETRHETGDQARDKARRSNSVATAPTGQSWDEASWEQEWEAADRGQSIQIPTYVPPPRWYDEPPAAGDAVPAEAVKPAQKQQSPAPGAQPRWTEALPSTASALAAGRDVWTEMRVQQTSERTRQHAHGDEEGELFSPESFDSYDTTVEPVQAIAANLIEFPRELIATRKARPRLAEGPLAAQENTQLSIFEVELDQLAPPIPLHGKVAPPEWASIELDHHREELAETFVESIPDRRADRAQSAERVNYSRTAVEGYKAMAAGTAGIAENLTGFARQFVSARAIEQEPSRAAQPELHAELQVASLSDRALAAVVDGACITLAFLAAAVVVTASTAHPPTGKMAMVAAACGLLLFGVLYQFLFLSYAEEGTPGMRYARIALCTFEDGNPTREQMRKRIPAMLLSILTLGLGFVWALADHDHVSWHDRLTRTYQRKY